MKKYKGHEKKVSLVQHQGIFRRQISLWEGVALILGGTVGAGVLGIPFAVAKVGIGYGLIYILSIGLLMMGLNLLVGEVAIRTGQNLQIVGFAYKYLGKFGGRIMSCLVYVVGLAILVIYIIGEGETLSVLFGGSAFKWSLIFWLLGSFLILVGMRTVKKVELFLTLGILTVVLFIVLISVPHLEYDHLKYSSLASLLLPYGVILFAFSGMSAIPEAYSILSNQKINFKKAIIIAGVLSIIIYSLFTFIVVGVTGAGTSEIATIGLGEKVGGIIFYLGNIFAILAMGTSFLLGGLALRDSLRWDLKMNYSLSTSITCIVPLILFLLGVRNFIATIDIAGGVFMSLQMILLLLIYWKAKQKGELQLGKYRLHHTVLLIALLFLALSIGAVYSVVKIF
ncbi:GerAB/ArcD/ProY family transporter [Patescibacteria group bacterium]|nr:GerAB/ArcD/ProY family transporter [Patescibacteria group bacterium]MBU1896126.1 GerAB/ArcD/ProY family transporter [Patescibacteria group bacterium]